MAVVAEVSRGCITIIGADWAIFCDFNISTRFRWILWQRLLPAPAPRLSLTGSGRGGGSGAAFVCARVAAGYNWGEAAVP
jgi:hypothetical protein